MESHEDKPFLVLELVEGDALAERLRRGAVGVEESLKLALQIAEALEAAHENGSEIYYVGFAPNGGIPTMYEVGIQLSPSFGSGRPRPLFTMNNSLLITDINVTRYDVHPDDGRNRCHLSSGGHKSPDRQRPADQHRPKLV